MLHYSDKFVGESELKTALRSVEIGRNGMKKTSVLLHNGRPKIFMKFMLTDTCRSTVRFMIPVKSTSVLRVCFFYSRDCTVV